VIAALIGEIFGLRHMGEIYGSTIVFAGIGGAAGPILAGYIYDVTTSYNLAFTLAGIMALAGALATCFIKMPKHY